MTEMKSKAHSFKETRRLEICINANPKALEMAMDGTLVQWMRKGDGF